MNEELCETREIRKKVYAICCPVCGKYQYRMLEGHTIFTCEKCKNEIEAIMEHGLLTMFETELSAGNQSLGGSRNIKMRGRNFR